MVSNGDDLGYNAPYFSENAPSSICSSTTFSGSTNCSTFDAIRPTEFASPFNSFTMSAKSNRYGYQLALGARGDAPLFARVGKFLT